jgi:hypothetical protein
MGNRHALLFISERSRLPVLISVREANRLRRAFPEAVCKALASVGVPDHDVEEERRKMSEIAFGRTSSRGLRGSLTDFFVPGQNAVHHVPERDTRADRS